MFQQGAAFVIPDGITEVAFSSLMDSGFLRCNQSLDCPHSHTLRAQSPPVFKHLHINDELAVLLYGSLKILGTCLGKI
jgi:hypothetical protein